MNNGRNIVITGAAGGLGSVVARKFLERGDTVVAPIHREESWNILRRGIESLDIFNIDAPVYDMTDEKSVDEFYNVFAERYGHVHALVHCIGGVRKWADVAETTVEDWDAVMNLNLRSAFLNTRAAMRAMTTQHDGSIVLISAMTALNPESKKAAYAAAKAGVIALMRTLANEGRSHRINANAIAPGIIRTEANLAWARGDESDAWTKPDSIAETIYLLTHPAARDVTGTVVPCNGGLGAVSHLGTHALHRIQYEVMEWQRVVATSGSRIIYFTIRSL